MILAAGRWSVSLLTAGQVPLAEHFANSGRDLATQFEGVPHRRGEVSGAAWIDGAAGWLDCVTETTVEAGDHTIVIGRVAATETAPGDLAPLTHFRGGWGPRP